LRNFGKSWHFFAIIATWTADGVLVVEVMLQLLDALVGEDAEDFSLLLGKF